MFVTPSEATRQWWIYKIVSPTNRVYVGVTSNIATRKSCYKNCPKYIYKQTAVYNSIKKYGFASHSFDVIDSFTSNLEYACGKELFWIKSYMCNKNKFPEQNGLNLCEGGIGVIGFKHTPEMIEKNRRNKLGAKMSQESSQKKREAMLGRKMNFTHMTDEFKKMLSERGKKQRHTEDAKKRIGEASKGNKYALGRKMTPEQIEHRSLLIRGTKIPKHIVESRTKKFIENNGTKVIQLSLDGVVINEFPSVSIAAKTLGIPRIGIFRALSGKYLQSRGFIFKHK